jgi:hypothetical protein
MGIITIEGNSEILKCDKCTNVLIPEKTYGKWHHLKGARQLTGRLSSRLNISLNAIIDENEILKSIAQNLALKSLPS